MKAKWNPQQYEKFKAQRAKPFNDLKNLIERKPIRNAIDLGCGTGELTRTLFDDLRPARMIGIDSSPEMLAGAKKFEAPGLTYHLSDITKYETAETFDLVFSNAALQWIPEHEELFPRILGQISDGGQVAIQMPVNFDHPSHRIAAEVAHQLFPAIFSHESPRSTLTLERYSEILFHHGFKNQVAKIEVYGHPMESGRMVVEWAKGTLLTGYQAKLNDIQFAKFLGVYQSELLKKIGEGPYFYAFKRALLWGIKNEGL